MWRVRGRGRIVAVAAGALLLVLLLAQLLLPRIAADRISARVGRYGEVISVHVSAWPAVQLLWGSAGSVTADASRLSISPAQASALLWEGRGARRIDFTVASLDLDGVRLSDVVMHKRGAALQGEATIGPQQVREALPAGISLRLLGSGGGRVRVLASGGLFGLQASLPTEAIAVGGRLLARPSAALLSGFQLSLFSDSHVAVTGVGARVLDNSPPGYRLTVAARLG